MVKRKNSFSAFVFSVLSFVIIFNNLAIVGVSANDGPEIVPFYTNITSCSVSLNVSGIKAECKATVRA